MTPDERAVLIRSLQMLTSELERVEGERDTLRAALVGVLAELDEGYEHITESQPTRDSDEVEFARSVVAGSGQVEAEPL